MYVFCYSNKNRCAASYSKHKYTQTFQITISALTKQVQKTTTWQLHSGGCCSARRKQLLTFVQSLIFNYAVHFQLSVPLDESLSPGQLTKIHEVLDKEKKRRIILNDCSCTSQNKESLPSKDNSCTATAMPA